jgi:hypothetical protein
MERRNPMHEWKFPAVVPFHEGSISGTQLFVVAVCKRCGAIRTSEAFKVTDDDLAREPIDLSGACKPPSAPVEGRVSEIA